MSAFPILQIRLRRELPVPLHRQLYDGIRDGVLQGHLSPGLVLPSSRELATRLGVGRNTVIAAYEQLQSEGFLSSRVGAGTTVSPLAGMPLDGISHRPGRRERVGMEQLSQRGRRLSAVSRGTSDPPGPAFVPGLPALDRFPTTAWSRILARHHRNATAKDLAYAQPAGHVVLRRALARYLEESRGVVCSPEQVIVVNGAQGALNLAVQMLLDPGDAAWIEEPGYTGARGALTAAGARLVPVPVTGDGLDAADGMKLGSGARLAYVTPSFQYPLGMTLSLELRLRLIDWATRSGAWILEDDYDSEYRYTGRPLSAMQGLDGAGRVVYLGTFSKTMFPALRVGYLVVPEGLQASFATAVRHTGHTASLPLQAALAEFIEDGHYATHMRRMRALYAARQQRFVDLARTALGDRAVLERPAGGMQLPAWLREESDDQRIAAAATARGLSITPLAGYHLGAAPRPGLHLGFAGIPEADVAPALETLTRCIDEVSVR